MDDFSQDHGVDGGDLTGFEHHGATRYQGGGDFQGDLAEWEIPRCDAAHHANRLPRDDRVADFFLPLELAGDFGKVAPVPGRAADLNGPRHFQWHADFSGNGHGQLVGTRLHPGGNFVEERRPGFHRQAGPAVKRSPGR